MLTLGLLPRVWFADQPQWLLLLISVVAIYVVIKGADWLVEGAAGVAYRLGMPKVVVGATIVSLGTTSPEAAVSVLAAWSGDAGLALGNGVGSIIADTGLIFGLGAMMTRLPADRFVLTRQGWVQFGSAVLLAVFCYGYYLRDGDAAVLGRHIGLLLVTLLVVYLAVSVRWARAHPFGEPFVGVEALKAVDEAAPPGAAVPAPVEAQRSIPSLVAWGVAGLALVVFAGDALVGSVSVLAETHWGVPKTVIAATLVAFGTSLPELIVGITAIAKKHAELLVGNVIGADILNVLFVIGAAALAKPLEVVEDGNPIFLYLHLPTMLIMLVLFRLYIFRAVRVGTFSRWMGLPLVLMYVAYVIVQYAISR